MILKVTNTIEYSRHYGNVNNPKLINDLKNKYNDALQAKYTSGNSKSCSLTLTIFSNFKQYA